MPDFYKYKYNGKELDLVHGLNTYDYGARQYNPVIPMWDRVDPLAHKYYNISPYAYCGNNPINQIDPDGKKIVLVNGSSSEFQNQYNSAISYLKSHGCIEQIEYLENCNEIVFLGETSKLQNTVYDHQERIDWNPYKGLLIMDSGNKLTPALLLFHEMCHEKHRLENPKVQ